MSWFLVGLGGVAGACTRYLLGKWITSRIHSPFPVGTWVINISGSFLLGALFASTRGGNLHPFLWEFIGIGFLGAYTTFSTFGYETLQLLLKNQFRVAILYVISSVAVGVLGAGVGQWVLS